VSSELKVDCLYLVTKRRYFSRMLVYQGLRPSCGNSPARLSGMRNSSCPHIDARPSYPFYPEMCIASSVPFYVRSTSESRSTRSGLYQKGMPFEKREPVARHAEFAGIISKSRPDGGIIEGVACRSIDYEVKWEIPLERMRSL